MINAMSRLLLAISIALVPASAVAGVNKPSEFDVLHYDIDLQPNFASKEIAVIESIRFKSLVDGLGTVSFTTSALEVAAELNGEKLETAVAGDRRIIRLHNPMRAGEIATLQLAVRAKEPKGFVMNADTVYTNYFTCHVIVCDQDRPGDKATVDLTLDLPAAMTAAVGPGRLISHETLGGLGRWRFRETRPTSPYLVGFAAGSFESVILDKHWPALKILANKGVESFRVRALFRDTRRMLRFFERKSGVPYDAPHYTQLLVDGDEAQEAARHSIIGMENIEPILKDPHEDWVIAHELAHQWWGNSLTCADWSELWLNEGLTVFMVAAYKEQRWGRAAYNRELDLARKRWDAAKTQGFDVPLSWKGEYPSLKLKRAMAYAKAVVFFDTLRTQLGDETFWRAIKDYTRTHKDSVVTAIDLERSFEQTSGRDLKPLFAEWVFGR